MLAAGLSAAILSAVLSGAAAFVGTNLDDIVVLATLFAQPSMRPRRIVAGQYLGFSALVLLSALAASGALLFPRAWIGALGLVPLLMGVRALVRAIRARGEPDEDAAPEPAGGVIAVALITLGNGGDNLGVYVPLFASAGRARMLLVLLVFALLLGLWCFLGYALARHPAVARSLRRHGHVVTPLVFVALGVYILVESGLVAYLAERVIG